MSQQMCELGHPVARDAEYCPVCMSTSLRGSSAASRPAAFAEPDPVRSLEKARANAQSLLRAFLIWGVVIYVAGSIIGVLARPDSPGAAGSDFLVLLGGWTAAAGGSLVAVGLIGFGVKYGREASDV